MNDRIIKKLKNKSGMTMLEVVVAVCILAIVVLAAVTAVNLSHSTVLSQGSSANAAAQAQDLADALITELHTKEPDAVKVETTVGGIDGVSYVSTFPDLSSTSSDRQFTINVVNDQNGVKGYKIRTAVFYTDSKGRKCVQMQAFSAKDGG